MVGINFQLLYLNYPHMNYGTHLNPNIWTILKNKYRNWGIIFFKIILIYNWTSGGKHTYFDLKDQPSCI
jgi:hypothetical protein